MNTPRDRIGLPPSPAVERDQAIVKVCRALAEGGLLLRMTEAFERLARASEQAAAAFTKLADRLDEDE